MKNFAHNYFRSAIMQNTEMTCHFLPTHRLESNFVFVSFSFDRYFKIWIFIIKWKLNVSFLIALIFFVVELELVFLQRRVFGSFEKFSYEIIQFDGSVPISFVYILVNNSSLYLSD